MDRRFGGPEWRSWTETTLCLGKYGTLPPSTQGSPNSPKWLRVPRRKLAACGAATISALGRLAGRLKDFARLATGKRFGAPHANGRCELSRRAFYRRTA
jgi:hypothetical protein